MRLIQSHSFWLFPVLLAIFCLMSLHGTKKNISNKQVSKVCTLGVYHPQIQSIEDLLNAQHSPSGKHKSNQKKGGQQIPIVVTLIHLNIPNAALTPWTISPEIVFPQAYSYLYFEEINPPPPKGNC